MFCTEETYRAAAKEHLARAQDLFDGRSYYLTHYLSGLAVECHLRGWLLRRRRDFESRHDLQQLAKESGYYDAVPSGQLGRFSALFVLMNTRWRSNHRYYSERQLLDYLSGIKAEFRVPGERWRNLARRVLGHAHEIINQGEQEWKRE